MIVTFCNQVTGFTSTLQSNRGFHQLVLLGISLPGYPSLTNLWTMYYINPCTIISMWQPLFYRQVKHATGQSARLATGFQWSTCPSRPSPLQCPWNRPAGHPTPPKHQAGEVPPRARNMWKFNGNHPFPHKMVGLSVQNVGFNSV